MHFYTILEKKKYLKLFLERDSYQIIDHFLGCEIRVW